MFLLKHVSPLGDAVAKTQLHLFCASCGLVRGLGLLTNLLPIRSACGLPARSVRAEEHARVVDPVLRLRRVSSCSGLPLAILPRPNANAGRIAWPKPAALRLHQRQRASSVSRLSSHLRGSCRPRRKSVCSLSSIRSTQRLCSALAVGGGAKRALPEHGRDATLQLSHEPA